MATKKKKTERFAVQVLKSIVLKQSSPRLSTLAAMWMHRAEVVEKVLKSDMIAIPTKDLKALAASVLSQDETKGQKR